MLLLLLLPRLLPEVEPAWLVRLSLHLPVLHFPMLQLLLRACGSPKEEDSEEECPLPLQRFQRQLWLQVLACHPRCCLAPLRSRPRKLLIVGVNRG